MSIQWDDVDDPADAFEYDEYGCLVELTPEAFDYFMLANASSARVGEVWRRLHGYLEGLQAVPGDPYVKGQWDAVQRLLVGSLERLQSPIAQLALMRLAQKCESAVSRFKAERAEEHRLSKWLEF